MSEIKVYGKALLPRHWDDFLPALAVAHMLKKRYLINMYYGTSDEFLFLLEPNEEPEPIDFNFMFDMTQKLPEIPGKHITELFCISIGAEPYPYKFPDLSHLPTAETRGGILLAQGGYWPERLAVRPDICVDPVVSPLTTFNLVRISDWVIGRASFATYLAATLGKNVIELYPDHKYERCYIDKFGGKGSYHLVGQNDEETLLRTLSLIGEPNVKSGSDQSILRAVRESDLRDDQSGVLDGNMSSV